MSAKMSPSVVAWVGGIVLDLIPGSPGVGFRRVFQGAYLES